MINTIRYTVTIIVIILCFGCDYFIKSESLPHTEQYENLFGKWKVVKSTVLPFEHISFCKKLHLNSVFEFNNNGDLNDSESTEEKECTEENQSYYIQENKLVIIEWDMIFDYEILKLNSDSLKLNFGKVRINKLEDFNFDIEKLQEENNEIEYTELIVTFIKLKSES